MSFRVVFEEPAARDIELAFEWYEARRSGLGAEFAGSVAAAAEVLRRDPHQFPFTNKPFQWVKLRRFPYAVHYRIEGDTVAIVACCHFRQSPSRWPGA